MMNFDLPAFYDKNVVFVGHGKEGVSFKKFIETYGNLRSFKFVDKKDDPQYLEHLKDLDLTNTVVVKTPGCPGYTMTVPYTTPTRVFFDCVNQLGAKSVGITGTKGKTTTSSLMAAVLKNSGIDARLCGNIGHPMLDALEGATQNTVFVVELSSYQLTELEQSPNVAIITNLYNDHIDYHGSIERYWEAKRNIMRFMDEKGVVIYNPESEVVLHWLADSKARGIAINPQENVDMSQAKLIGDHNKQNYLMVRAAAELFGIDRMSSQSVFNNFEPIRHRLQPVRTVRGITFVDDAIGSTPEATIAGIQALVRNKGPIGCVMLGGVDRQYDFTDLVKTLKVLMIPKLVLFPDTGAIIHALLPDDYAPETFNATDMDEAVQWAYEHTPSGSICLLSTAAPSTVLWSSFEEKGSLFQKAVLELPA
ncbi:UDP-N-acetylmuramoyl-L-alanine--D-glutamate ligase [Candidatus Saccharibacteria bacterium]|nr:UDP-N-acetylmuramoyl-L-alanine--D-glutamate ligase [Candidatus Saccharibacteria bacterium]